MGLAPYGEPEFVSTFKDNVIEIKEDGSFNLNMRCFDYPHSYRMSSSFLHKLLKKAPYKLESKEKIDVHYMNVASSVHKIVEEVVVKLSKTLYQNTKINNLCMAGGVALNCVANEKILKQSPFESLWIQPAAGDAGGSLGSAYSVWYEFLKKPRRIKKPDSMKGAMECGPRALGCRSILGDARLEDMQRKMNQKIKFRESFRPFAISILEEKVGDFFENVNSPYMLLVSYILPVHRKNELKINKTKGLEKQNILKSPLSSCTHVDYSCRIQTVGGNAPVRFRKLLEAFYKKTKCPGLINTSFNVRGEPIVCSPYEAYRCFMNTDMDICVINDFILRKEEQKTEFKDLYVDELEVD